MSKNYYRFGDVVLVNIPWIERGTGRPLTKVRPAVVVSRDHLNEQGRHVVLPISSRPAKGDEIPVPEWEAAGLAKPSKMQIQPFFLYNIQTKIGVMHPAALLAAYRSLIGYL